MEMGLFDYSPAKLLAQEALNKRSLRQDLIASNIANVDTPFYRPKDIDFEEALAKQANEMFGEKKPELKLAKTEGAHMDKYEDVDSDKATIFYRDGHLAGNDGNSVDLDVEMSEQSKNGIMYNALVEGLKKNGAIMKLVIDSSSKLS